jgi:PAT family beta-lactamase induction signal transducer AmpG
MFLLVVAAFVAAFWGLERGFWGWLGMETGHFGGFLWGLLRLLLALAAAWWAGRLVVALRLVPGSVLRETYLDPLRDFFRRYGRMALLILLLIGCYRISDIVLGVISNVFYTDLGFDKHQIADITKTFGLLMTLLGGFLGGALALRYGVMPVLFLGALLSAATNLLFMVLAQQGPDLAWLVLVISADNISGGIAAAAFVAYLSGLTQVSFTAFQYALFSSLMLLVPKFLGGYSGTIVDAIGYQNFFMITALIGLPVLLLIWLAARYVPTGARSLSAG